MKSTFRYTALIAAVGLTGSALASSDLLVYEGFDYGPANTTRQTGNNDGLLHGQPDGVGGDINATGLSGTWQDSTGISSSGTIPTGGIGDLFLSTGSLAFGDLVVPA